MTTSTDPTVAPAGPAYADSPHGSVAEKDRWVAKRWAPHGDQNEAADSDALNTTGADLARALDTQGENERAEAFKEGPDYAEAVAAENKAARRAARSNR